MDEAVETARQILNPGIRSSALREVVMIRGTHGTYEDVAEAVGRIPEQKVRLETVATLAIEQAEAGNSAAGSTLQTAWNMAIEAPPDVAEQAVQSIVVARSVLGDFATAEQLVDTMNEPESRIWPLWNLTSMLARAGRTEEALALAEGQDSELPKAYALLGTAQGILDRAKEKEKGAARR